MPVQMGKSRPLLISISANQIREFGSSQSLWDSHLIIENNKTNESRVAWERRAPTKFFGSFVHNATTICWMEYLIYDKATTVEL